MDNQFYHFINSSDYDFTRYQIYRTLEEAIADQRNSLEYTLRALGVYNTSLDHIINGGSFYNQCHILPQRQLSLLAKKLSMNVNLIYCSASGRRISYYSYPRNRPYTDNIHICRYMNRYMPSDNLVLEEDANRKKPRKQGLLSYTFISKLIQNNMIQLVKIHPALVLRPILINLQDVLGEQSLFSYAKTKSRTYASISYGDVESIGHGTHIPFMYGKCCNDEFSSYTTTFIKQSPSVAYNEEQWDGFRAFLESYPNGHNMVYFHNLKYDWHTIKKAPFIYIRSMVKKDSTYYSVSFSYYYKVFEFRDSYKYIPKPLAAFSATFGLKMEKHEYIIYSLYTLLNVTKAGVSCRPCTSIDTPEEIYTVGMAKSGKGLEKQLVPILELADYVLLDERIAVSRLFLEVCKDYITVSSEEAGSVYYHMAHLKFYLEIDCRLLAEGMTVYEQRMKEILGVSCHDKLTLPSIVHYSLCEAGCYSDVYEVSESLRKFIAPAAHGGRVVARDNKMWDITTRCLVLDARSLYSSSERRICNPTTEDTVAMATTHTAGFPTGQAKCITSQEHWNQRDSWVYYVVRISITAIKKHQQIPFVSYHSGHSREYVSSMFDSKGEAVKALNDVSVDKIALEDWVKFQGIEYTFIEGVYWDEGGNTAIGNYVESLYTTRRKFISEGNVSMSELCKLALNSLYGKTICRPNDTKVVVKTAAQAEQYEMNNADSLCDRENCHNSVIFSVMKDDVTHKNMAHIGSMILSMSRRIMNEVLDIANEIGVPVMYTDTDSMHIVDSVSEGVESRGVARLEAAYKERYGRDLVGVNLGQFSMELKFPGHTNIRSERCIILGKKVYIHWVCGDRLDDRGEVVTDSYGHCRAKGVSASSFNEHVVTEEDKMQLYERMYNGESIAFNLAYSKPKFIYDATGVKCIDKSIRNISFQGDKGSVDWL